ncbi:hypothetical protein C2G38_2251038 [Gigaspora rosea]|uniref:Uncharacterized protein n=1 Tax=Gigaspora rosea TaxID=44941 RepID=A0A397US36_9GLOM|nr:hypothetical protein C2G38_2251038 [Gigaspora rosea]
MAKEFKSINFINFPNREEELDDIIYCMTFLCGFNLVICSYELPLIKMDLTAIESYLFYFGLTLLSLSGTKLTDVGMSALKNLTELYLDRTSITDAGIIYLDSLRELTHLSLNKPRIKYASLSTIRKSTFANKKVIILRLDIRALLIKGVREFGGLPHLSFLNLNFTQVFLSCRNFLADLPSIQPVRLNGVTKEVCEDEYYDV